MGRVLFLNFNAIWSPHFDTDLEIMLDLLKKGVDVYSLSCNNNFNHFCISNMESDNKYCKRCQKTLKKGLDLIKLKQENRLNIEKYLKVEHEKFNSIEEIRDFTIDNINIGLGVASSIMMTTRDYNFSLKDNKNLIDKLLNVSYTALESVKRYQNIYNFDAIYMFNGRFAEYYSIVDFCKQNGITFYLHERGSEIDSYELAKNDLIHSFYRMQKQITSFWNQNDNIEYKTKIANDWFQQRRNGIVKNWVSFTDYQQKNNLPDDFDVSKQNIVIFNSSLDEYIIFDDWQNPIEKNENILIKNIVKHYTDDDSKHFYLRIHPNLKGVNTSQLNEIRKFDSDNYKNLTVIYPEDDIDSYALMDNCDKTLVNLSTTGIESAYWGNVSIVMGKALYSALGANYVANNYEELFKLIDSTNLKPKSKEKTYQYAYWASKCGTKFKYYNPVDIFHGTFLGVDLRKKPIYVKIRLAIQNYFKK